MNMNGTASWCRCWLMSLICVGAFLVAACAEKSTEAEDPCDATAKPFIEPLFRIHFVIAQQSGGPYTGPATFAIEKHYCNGTVSGRVTDGTLSTLNGYWKPITTQYRLANENDFVLVEFAAGTYQMTHDYGYQYVKDHAALIDYDYIFDDTLHVTVP